MPFGRPKERWRTVQKPDLTEIACVLVAQDTRSGPTGCRERGWGGGRASVGQVSNCQLFSSCVAGRCPNSAARTRTGRPRTVSSQGFSTSSRSLTTTTSVNGSSSTWVTHTLSVPLRFLRIARLRSPTPWHLTSLNFEFVFTCHCD